MSNFKKLLFLIVVVAVLISFRLLAKDYNANPNPTPQPQASNTSELLPWPLEKADQRQTLLKFSMYVTPNSNQNPITPPERFSGYHTGLDIEILPEEIEAVVPVKTICDGKIIYTGTIEGYGGVVIQECTLNNQPTSVLYGHVKPSSIKVSQGDEVIRPETIIAELGDTNSEETGNTRKHLHLGIHKGNHIEFLGYVTDEKDLQEFIDPLLLLQK
jgi:murein DD-endopeptidase MepM/ murein hydrolase activator NlpD